MKKGKAIGGSLLWVLLFLGIQIILSVAVSMGSVFTGSADSMEQLVSGTMPVTLVLCNTATVVILLLIVKLRGDRFSTALGLKRTTAANILLSVLLAASLVPLVNLLLSSVPLSDSLAENYDQLMEMAVSDSALSVLSVTLLAPVCEEFIFRGAVFRTLRQAFPAPFCILFSSFLFGLVHFNLIQSSYAFLLGIILCLLCLRFDSLWISVAAHIAFNILGGYLDLTGFSPGVQLGVQITGAVLALALGAWMIFSRKSAAKNKNNPGDSI